MADISAGIIGVGMYAPEKVLTNAELAGTLNTTAEWIETMSGITTTGSTAMASPANDLNCASVAASTAPALSANTSSWNRLPT